LEREWHGLIVLTVDEFHEDLDALKLIALSEYDGPLGMLEVKCLIRVRSPIAQALQEKLGPNMLEQYSHGLGFMLTSATYTFSLVPLSDCARSKVRLPHPEYYGGRNSLTMLSW